jgi:hypothetical protein
MLREWMKKDLHASADRGEAEKRALDELDPADRQQLEILGYIH